MWSDTHGARRAGRAALLVAVVWQLAGCSNTYRSIDLQHPFGRSESDLAASDGAVLSHRFNHLPLYGPPASAAAEATARRATPEVIEAVMLRGGRIRKRVAAVKSLASALTIGTGGSVGREGPIVQIGAAVGSAVGQILRLPSEQIKTLAACGAGAGIAAVFNAPIAGAFFALEVVTGNFAMPSFSPVILSSVMATVVSRAYFGDYPAFIVQPYKLESVYEIAIYAGLGIACGVVGVVFVWIMDRMETLAPRLPIPKMWRPAAGGLLLGAMLIYLPDLYGVGYGTMDGALSGRISWKLLALLLPIKMIATTRNAPMR